MKLNRCSMFAPRSTVVFGFSVTYGLLCAAVWHLKCEASIVTFAEDKTNYKGNAIKVCEVYCFVDNCRSKLQKFLDTAIIKFL